MTVTLTGVGDEPDVDGGPVRCGVTGVGAVLVNRRREANVAHLQPHDLVGEVGPFTHDVWGDTYMMSALRGREVTQYVINTTDRLREGVTKGGGGPKSQKFCGCHSTIAAKHNLGGI